MQKRLIQSILQKINLMIKAGILGGGQLGRMLLQAAANYPVTTYVMENDGNCPSAHLCHHFTKGDITNADDVFSFGKDLDVVTIEIESVSTEGLERLQQHGVKVFPTPDALRTIKNKARQKEFYQHHSIPTAPFVITHSKDEVQSHSELFPAVHKAAMGGYDGKGVQVIDKQSDWSLAFDSEAVLEKKVSIKKEIAIIIGVDQDFKKVLYPPAEMIFDPSLNLLQYQLSPAVLPEKTLWKAEAMSLAVVEHLGSPGIFAVELFIDNEDNVWLNETAPRVHNSGHHTIEGNYCSQFDMLWRIMLKLPAGSTKKIMDSALVNLIGQNNETLHLDSDSFREILKIENAFVHLYGKKESRPGRKMGHVTILSTDRIELVHLANKVRNLWENKY